MPQNYKTWKCSLQFLPADLPDVLGHSAAPALLHSQGIQANRPQR